jgi:hypothetical protein
MKQKDYKDYVLIFILLVISGNSFSAFLFGKFTTLIALIVSFFLVRKDIKAPVFFLNKVFKVFVFLIIIFFLQLLELGFVSWLGVFNFFVKIFTGGLIIYYFKNRFPDCFFKGIYFLSLTSLIFFLLVNIIGLTNPQFKISEDVTSYIIYSTAYHPNQNMGMFWEPGAFAGIITLCLVLNFNNLLFYWKNSRFKLIVIIIALLSTQSTTGYITLFIILLFYFIKKINSFVVFFIMPIVLLVSFYIYNNTDFLNAKLSDQYSAAQTQNIGELSNTRFGSIVFDWYYIKKHPLIGNGMNEKTRYADHQYLFAGSKGEDVIGSGNGFSNFLASMGVFFMFGYFFLLYKSFINSGIIYTVVCLLVIFLNLQGEQWFNFPIYLGLPFFGLFKKYDKKLSFKTKRSQAV